MNNLETVAGKWNSLESPIKGLSSNQLILLADFSCSTVLPFYEKYGSSLNGLELSLVRRFLLACWQYPFRGHADNFHLFRAQLQSESELLQDKHSATEAQEACFACMVLSEMILDGASTAQCMRVFRFVSGIIDLRVQERLNLPAGRNVEEAILADHEMQDEFDRHQSAIQKVIEMPVSETLVRTLQGLARFTP